MILYGSSFSPFVRKTLAYLNERGLPFELQQITLVSAPPEFYAASPFKKMPALVDGDFAISDSSAIITYLDAKYPDGGLLPTDPADRARVIWFEEFADTIMTVVVFKCFFNRVVAPYFLRQSGDEAAAKQGETVDLPPMLDYLEQMIPEAGGFLVGGKLTVADLAVASCFVNYDHAGIEIDGTKYPKTKAWVAAMHARPSFATGIAKEKAVLAKTMASTN